MKKEWVVLCLLVLFFAGCSSNRQFLDANWTQKPAKMKILFTKPTLVIQDQEFQTIGAATQTPNPVLLWFWNKNDNVEIPETMEAVADWFREKVDNVMQFNSNVPCVVERVSKKNISRETENMDGLEVKIPKVQAMSDSFDVYMIMDEVQMKISSVVSTASTGGSAGTIAIDPTALVPPMFKGESTKIIANYVFYDVKTGKRLAYGHWEEKLYHDEIAAEQGWNDNLRRFMLRILGTTPVTRFK